MSPLPTVAEPGQAEAALLEAAWRHIQPTVARRLLVAAVLEFATRGYHATTTRDIAGRAGLSPAGVYVHFRSKEELLYRSSLIGHQQALELIRAAAASTSDARARLRAVVADFTAWHARYHTAARVSSYELAALLPEHAAEIAALRRDIDAVVRAVLHDGVRRGVFAVADIPGTAVALLSLAVDVARWYRPAGRHDPASLGAFYADLAERMCIWPPAASPS